MRKIKLLLAYILLMVAVITPVFSNWIVNSVTDNTAAATYTSKKAICYNATTNVKYLTLEAAVNNASSGQKIYVIPGSTVTVTGSIELNNNISIYLPYNATTTKEFVASGSAQLVSTVEFKNGADLTIGSGSTFEIGGVIGKNGITGKYCLVYLGSGSSITVNGTLNSYGKIAEKNAVHGDNTNYENIIYDNSNDSSRFIEVNNGGLVTTSLAMYDIGSGSTLTGKINNYIFPSYNYDFPSIQTHMKFNYGSSFDGVCYLEIAGTTLTQSCGIVRKSSSSDTSLFFMDNGSLEIEYGSTKNTLIYINGDIKMGYLRISKSSYTIDTREYVLPIHNKMKMFLNGIFDTNHISLKFLPGSFMAILSNGSFRVNGTNSSPSKIYFYRSASMTSLGVTTYGTADAKIIVDGSIVVNEYGYIGGYLVTDNLTGEASVDLSSVSNENNLSIVTKEYVGGSAVDIPDLVLTGPFYDSTNTDNDYISDSNFPGAQTIHSYSGKKCWYQENVVRNYDIRVTVNTSLHNYTYNAFNYSIYTNTSSTGSGTALVENSTTASLGPYSVLGGTYVKITDDVAASLKVNGNSTSFNTWIRVDSNLSFEIEPTEAYLIECYHTNGTSGAGQIQRSITYGPTSSSMPYSKSVSDGSKVSVQVPQGWKFKVSDNANVSGTSSIIKDGETIATKSKGIAWSSSTVYTADGNYKFVSDNVNCLVEGTLITMADGTKKPVEELQVGDMVMAYDHFGGSQTAMPIIFINHSDEQSSEYDVINLDFSSGEQLKIVGEHGLFDMTLNKYVYFNYDNYRDFIGHQFYCGELVNDLYHDGLVTLVDANVTTELTRIYCPVTYFHMNVYANGLLTMANMPFGGDGLVNYFEYDLGTVNFNKELMAQDIAQYGTYCYDDFKDYISYEAYCSSPSVYLKVSVGKGYLTYQDIIDIIKYLLSNSLIDNQT